jgi:hypothetical protein
MPEETKTEEAIKKRLHEIFPDQQTASRVVNLIVNKRPVGWGRKSIAPYYKRIFAEQIKKEIDLMIENGAPRVYRYSTWCNENGMSPQTLYNRVNQSIRYLIEQMDTPELKYAKWYESVNITRRSEVGVVIEFIPGMREGFSAEEVQPEEHRPMWRRRLDDWLESDNTKPFIEDRLALSPEQIVQIKIELEGLSNLQYSVTSDAVKIIKLAQ